MKLDGWIDAYLDHLRAERALAANTLSAYARDLKALVEHVGEVEPQAIDTGSIAELLVGNVRRGFGARSSARQLSALRGFFRFLVRERVISSDPTKLVDHPRLSRKLPTVLSEEEVERLLGMPDRETPRGLRDSAMIHLMYASGLRVSELVSLKITDMDTRTGLVSALGKGSKRRLGARGRGRPRSRRTYVRDVRWLVARPKDPDPLRVASWGAAHAARLLEAAQGRRARRRHHDAAVAAQASPLVRDAPTPAWR